MENQSHADDDEQIEDDNAEEFFAFQGDKKKKVSQARARAESAQYNIQEVHNLLGNPSSGLDNEF